MIKISKKVYEDIVDYIHEMKSNLYSVPLDEDIKMIYDLLDISNLGKKKYNELHKYLKDMLDDVEKNGYNYDHDWREDYKDVDKILKMLNFEKRI